MGARTGIVTGRITAANRNTGRPVRLLQVQLTDANDVQTIQLVEQMGEESNPVNGSLVTVVTGGLAFKQAVACHDGIEPIMSVGGKRVYSIDPATNAVIAELKLDPDGKTTLTTPNASATVSPDGEIDVRNNSASAVIKPDGKITVAGPVASVDMAASGAITVACTTLSMAGTAFTISVDVAGLVTVNAPTAHFTGNITCDGDVTASGVSLVNHVHSGVTTGPGDTGAPV